MQCVKFTYSIATLCAALNFAHHQRSETNTSEDTSGNDDPDGAAEQRLVAKLGALDEPSQ